MRDVLKVFSTLLVATALSGTAFAARRPNAAPASPFGPSATAPKATHGSAKKSAHRRTRKSKGRRGHAKVRSTAKRTGKHKAHKASASAAGAPGMTKPAMKKRSSMTGKAKTSGFGKSQIHRIPSHAAVHSSAFKASIGHKIGNSARHHQVTKRH